MFSALNPINSLVNDSSILLKLVCKTNNDFNEDQKLIKPLMNACKYLGFEGVLEKFSYLYKFFLKVKGRL
jgi:hypothetical protein